MWDGHCASSQGAAMLDPSQGSTGPTSLGTWPRGAIVGQISKPIWPPTKKWCNVESHENREVLLFYPFSWGGGIPTKIVMIHLFYPGCRVWFNDLQCHGAQTCPRNGHRCRTELGTPELSHLAGPSPREPDDGFGMFHLGVSIVMGDAPYLEGL